jgi:hypothetical protein
MGKSMKLAGGTIAALAATASFFFGGTAAHATVGLCPRVLLVPQPGLTVPVRSELFTFVDARAIGTAREEPRPLLHGDGRRGSFVDCGAVVPAPSAANLRCVVSDDCARPGASTMRR